MNFFHIDPQPWAFHAAPEAFCPTQQAGKPQEGPALVFTQHMTIYQAPLGGGSHHAGLAPTSRLPRKETPKPERGGQKPQNVLLTYSPSLLLSVLIRPFHLKHCWRKGCAAPRLGQGSWLQQMFLLFKVAGTSLVIFPPSPCPHANPSCNGVWKQA